jgi:hypothetical protein
MDPESELLVETWCPLADFDPKNSEEPFNGVEEYLDTKAHGLSAQPQGHSLRSSLRCGPHRNA